MQLAHTLGESGPEIELLMVAAAMLVLGIVFFIQKTVKPVVPVVLVVGAFALAIGAFAAGGSNDGDSQSAGSPGDATIAITTPADEDTVPAGRPVRVEVDLTDGPPGGHFDVRIDDEIVTMTPETNPQVTFEPGEHVLSVEYVNNRHQSFDPPLRDEITVRAE